MSESWAVAKCDLPNESMVVTLSLVRANCDTVDAWVDVSMSWPPTKCDNPAEWDSGFELELGNDKMRHP